VHHPCFTDKENDRNQSLFKVTLACTGMEGTGMYLRQPLWKLEDTNFPLPRQAENLKMEAHDSVHSPVLLQAVMSSNLIK